MGRLEAAATVTLPWTKVPGDRRADGRCWEIRAGEEEPALFRARRPEQAWLEVRQAKELTQQAFEEVGRWVRALRPLSLERQPTTEAMARGRAHRTTALVWQRRTRGVRGCGEPGGEPVRTVKPC